MINRIAGWMLAGALALGSALAAAADAPLPVVAAVDLDRYAGKWHEIARYPNRFERMCVADVTATYTRNADGTIAVVNDCRKADGTRERADGLARVVQAPAKLQVRFAPAWLSWLPLVWGDYWIVDLDPDYRYVIVGEPSREYLWILAREPALDDETWHTLYGKLPRLGYDPDKLVRNPGTTR
jgi:apolipoprotein D and lipocalin family protein